MRPGELPDVVVVHPLSAPDEPVTYVREDDETVEAFVRARSTCHITEASRKYVLSDGTELFDDGCSECNGYLQVGDNYCPNCGAKVVSE